MQEVNGQCSYCEELRVQIFYYQLIKGSDQSIDFSEYESESKSDDWMSL
jgi:hypothetical protein